MLAAFWFFTVSWACDPPATWFFISSGIIVLFAGLFNLLALLTKSRTVVFITIPVNLLLMGLCLYRLKAGPVVHVHTGVVLFLLAALLAAQNEKGRQP